MYYATVAAPRGGLDKQAQANANVCACLLRIRAYENMCARACHDPDARIRVPNPVRACRQRVCRHLLPGPDALRQRRLNFWRQREAMALSLVLLGASLAMSATAIATKDAQARGRSGEAELPS